MDWRLSSSSFDIYKLHKRTIRILIGKDSRKILKPLSKLLEY